MRILKGRLLLTVVIAVDPQVDSKRCSISNRFKCIKGAFYFPTLRINVMLFLSVASEIKSTKYQIFNLRVGIQFFITKTSKLLFDSRKGNS